MSCWLRRWVLGADHDQQALELKRAIRKSVHDVRNSAQKAVGASERSIRASTRATQVAAAVIARIEEIRPEAVDDEI